MMIFTYDMKPSALVQNSGKPMSFKCDMCGTHGDGVVVNPGKGREEWAVLPEEWSEIEDCRKDAKKQFVVCCESSDCRYEAEKHSG